MSRLPTRPVQQKQPPLRDRRYLNYLRTQRCVLTGRLATEDEKVDPAHIGTSGKGIKSPDDEALPITHSVHRAMHQGGEMTILRGYLTNDLLRDMARAYAREQYRKYKARMGT